MTTEAKQCVCRNECLRNVLNQKVEAVQKARSEAIVNTFVAAFSEHKEFLIQGFHDAATVGWKSVKVVRTTEAIHEFEYAFASADHLFETVHAYEWRSDISMALTRMFGVTVFVHFNIEKTRLEFVRFRWSF